jgi:hypothetical protein
MFSALNEHPVVLFGKVKQERGGAEPIQAVADQCCPGQSSSPSHRFQGSAEVQCEPEASRRG